MSSTPYQLDFLLLPLTNDKLTFYIPKVDSVMTNVSKLNQVPKYLRQLQCVVSALVHVATRQNPSSAPTTHRRSAKG